MTPLAISPTGTELLDDPAADPAAVATSLRNVARANRWFGGWAAVRWGLDRLLRPRPRGPLTLLDVGAGLGDLSVRARRWAAGRGMRLDPVCLDRSPVAARLARDAGLQTVIGCGGELPVGHRGVDLVVVSQVAHHLSDDSCVALFRECARVARRGVIVADLFRSRAAAAGFWLGSHLLRFDGVTRADGLTSLRRGFSRHRLTALLGRAGLEARAVRRPGARLVAVWSAGR